MAKKNYAYYERGKIVTPVGKIRPYKDENSLPDDLIKLYWMGRYYYHQYRFVLQGKNDEAFKITEIIYNKFLRTSQGYIEKYLEEYQLVCGDLSALYERHYGIENEQTKDAYLRYMEISLLNKKGKSLFWSLYLYSRLLFRYFNEVLEILFRRIEQDNGNMETEGIECFNVLMTVYPMKFNGRKHITNHGTKALYISEFFADGDTNDKSLEDLAKEISEADEIKLQSIIIEDLKNAFADIKAKLIQEYIDNYRENQNTRRKSLYDIIMVEKEESNFQLKDSVVAKLSSDDLYDIVEIGCVLSYFDLNLAFPYTSKFFQMKADHRAKDILVLLNAFGTGNLIFTDEELKSYSIKLNSDLCKYYECAIHFYPELLPILSEKKEDAQLKEELTKLAEKNFLDSQHYLDIFIEREADNQEISDNRSQLYSLDLPLEEKAKILEAVYKSMNKEDQKSEFFITQCIGYEDTLDLMYALIPSFGIKGLGILLKGLIIYLKANSEKLGPEKELDICSNIIKQLKTTEPKEYTESLSLLALQYALLYYQLRTQGADAKNLYNRILSAIKGSEEGIMRLACYFREKELSVFLALYMPIVQSWIKSERYDKLFEFYYQENQRDIDRKEWYKISSIKNEKLAYHYLDKGECIGDGECYLLDYRYRSEDIEDLIRAAKCGNEMAYLELENLRMQQELLLADLRRKAAVQQEVLSMKMAEEETRRRRNLEISESLASLAITGEMKNIDQVYYSGGMDDLSYFIYQDWKDKQIKKK